MDDDTIEESVIDAIKSGETRMRPRWVFVVRAILMAIFVVLLFAALLYLASFIIFALHQDDVWFAPDFGIGGWSLLFAALPWSLLLFSLVILVVLANIMNRYAFVYHRPLFEFLFVVVILVVLGSFWIAATSFHAGVFHYAEEDVPIVGRFYEFETNPPACMHRGVVTEVASSGFMIMDGNGATSVVIAGPGVVSSGGFRVGDTVIVFGNRNASGSIQAHGVQEIIP